ncbi:hypothetical protein DY000_02006011 [Brassica cretica]|uniref:F-box associated beta-propeller type 3 domain-containing protein n=1 Tax=Brassica cretica TaxID=69181 RepID=A0ABQ7C066_BRACR|nr:hypothetical protein DY000_02006011 [Brassica cretica]
MPLFSCSARVLLPEISYHKYCNMGCDGFVGYDLVEDQVFTLLGGPKKQQLRSLDIQGTWNLSLEATFTGLSIDGIIYYIEKSDIGRNELVWFDFRLGRFERLYRIQMPITLQMNQLNELTLVNYKGKLGCIRHTDDSAEMWIMEDHHKKKQEWSKIIPCIPHTIIKILGFGPYGHCFAGVTPYGEIVIIPKRLESKERLKTYYYDPIPNVIKLQTLHLEKTMNVGHRYYEELRPLSYRGADVFVLSFSLVSRASYENVFKKWIPELQHFAPGVPLVLVGTKLDLREDKHYLADHPGLSPVTTAQGEELRKLIGATYYIECSSKTQQNVKAVFDSAIKEVIKPVVKQKEKTQKTKKQKSNHGCLSNVLCGRIVTRH